MQYIIMIIIIIIVIPILISSPSPSPPPFHRCRLRLSLHDQNHWNSSTNMENAIPSGSKHEQPQDRMPLYWNFSIGYSPNEGSQQQSLAMLKEDTNQDRNGYSTEEKQE